MRPPEALDRAMRRVRLVNAVRSQRPAASVVRHVPSRARARCTRHATGCAGRATSPLAPAPRLHPSAAETGPAGFETLLPSEWILRHTMPEQCLLRDRGVRPPPPAY